MITPDSGTSLITAPSWAEKILQDILPYEEDCKDDRHFGTLSFVVNGEDYHVHSHHFM